MHTHGRQGRGGKNCLLSLRWHWWWWWQLQRAQTRRTTMTRAPMIICGRAIGIYRRLLLHWSLLLHAPGLHCWQSWRRHPGGGRKKSSSTPTSTSMMATPNSANKWDYNDKGTYDNLQIAVPHRLIDLRNEVKLIGPTKLPMVDIAKILHWMKLTILLKKDVHSGKNWLKA